MTYNTSFLSSFVSRFLFFFFQAEDGIRDSSVTGVQTCALPISKYRGKSAASPAPAPSVEHQMQEERPTVEETASRPTGNLPATAPSGGNVPRRFSGGLPRWLLADAGTEAEAAPSGEAVRAADETSAAGSALAEPSHGTAGNSAA